MARPAGGGGGSMLIEEAINVFERDAGDEGK